MNIQAFADRRARLMQIMGHGIALIPTAPERVRNRDSHYPFRHDSYFYYLSGFTEPDACLLLVAGDQPRSLLFCREKDADQEVWGGFRHGPQAARASFGFDEAYPISRLDEKLGELLGGQSVLHYALGHDTAWDTRVLAALNRVRARTRNGERAPADIRDVRGALDEMRLIKDSQELALMRRAADISAAAHRRAMRACAPGRFEYEIEAELLHEFRRQGAQAPAYASIVACGAHACTLHYVDNSQSLQDGALLLIDAGCELDSYAADITRTFPVNGKFTGAQRDLYALVLAAQEAALAEVAPGKSWNTFHDAAVRVLTQGMIDLGLIEGGLDGALEAGAYQRFYMHRTGHWLGLDVHDAGEYKIDGAWRPLVPGMTLTVEPGCYIRAADDIPEAFWNIGIRIEDNALVTDDGHEILTAAAPKSIGEIEALMAGR